MGRKRKHYDCEGESRSGLPPCRVCDAPGAGFHYGANTCEACKGFFHRSLKIHGQYKCDGNFCCTIEHGRNKLCQYCRYQKCLSVGMAKEAIKTGRYTSAKRTNDILEVKRLQEKKLLYSPADTHGVLNIHTLNSINSCENSSDCDSQTGHCSVPFTNTLRQLSSGCVTQNNSQLSCSLILDGSLDIVNASSRRQYGNISLKTADVSQACFEVADMITMEIKPDPAALEEIESLFSDSPRNYDHPQEDQSQQQNATLSSKPSPFSVTSSYGSPPEGIITKPSSCMLKDVATTLLSLSTAPVQSPCLSSPASLMSPAASYTSPAASHTLPTCINSPLSLSSINSPPLTLLSPISVTTSPESTSGASSSSTLGVKMYITDSPGSDSVGDSMERNVSELYRDKDKIVSLLLTADEDFIVPLMGKMSEEEIKQQQNEHFEACRLQREIFGQLRRLPDHEYDYIFATTGLDMDDRQKRLCVMGAGLEKVIRAMVKFCKLIPGFTWVDICDKVKLIKYSRQEFCLFTIYKFIDAEKRIMRGLDNQWKCENEISRMSCNDDSDVFMENLDMHFRFCRSLQDLKLSNEELVVIRALIVMAPDRDPHVDCQLVREIHWGLNECLIHILSKRYPNPLIIYAKILGKLAEARSQTQSMISFFKRLKINKYSNVMNNPLLREMCSGIFFDEKDDDKLFDG